MIVKLLVIISMNLFRVRIMSFTVTIIHMTMTLGTVTSVIIYC